MKRLADFVNGLSRSFTLLLGLGLAASSMPAMASTLLVDTLGEPASGDVTSANCVASACTLRDAINSARSGDTIRFAPALDGMTITLTLFSNDQGCVTSDATTCSSGGSLSTEFGPSAFFITNANNIVIDGLTGLTHGVTIARDTTQPAFRLFDIDSGSNLTLSGVTVANGFAQGGGSPVGGGGALGAGGAVFNQGSLTIDRCTFVGNTAVGGSSGPESAGGAAGGGVGADADPGGNGGGPNGGEGAFNASAGSFGGGGGLGVDAGFGGAGGFGGGGGSGGGSVRGGNGGFGAGGGSGGGVGGYGGGNGTDASGGGGAGMGGAIFNDAGVVSITNSTFFSNQVIGGSSAAASGGAGYGGAIFNYNGSLTQNFVTIVGNTVAGGAGTQTGDADVAAIFSLGDLQCSNGNNPCPAPNATLTMDNSIVYGNTGGSFEVGIDVVFASGDSSVATTASGSPDNLIGTQLAVSNLVLTSLNPKLATSLSANRGFGMTLYPLPGSPAIDAVPCGSVSVDERGVARPQGAKCDLGAVEAQATSTTFIVTGNLEPASGFIDSANCSGNQCPTLRDAVNSALPGDVIRFAPTLDGSTITLSLFRNDLGISNEFGPSAFFINGSALTIDALTGLSKGITISRDTTRPPFRLFDVDSVSTLNLLGLTLSNGLAQGGGSDFGGGALGAGGAVFNQGTLTMNRCTLNANTARGGGIFIAELPFGNDGGGGGVGGDTSGPGGGPNGGVESGNGGSGGFGGGGGQGNGGAAGNGGFGGGGGADFTSPFGFFSYNGGGGGNGGFGGGGGGECSLGGFGGGDGHANAGTSGSGGGMGGAIFNDAGSVAVLNTTLSGNQAVGGSNDGFGGAQGSSSGGNGSGFGGAIFNYSGSLSLNFVTMSGNSVNVGVGGSGGSADGGSIYSLGDGQCGLGGNICSSVIATLTMDNSIAANSIGSDSEVFIGLINGGSSTAVTSTGSPDNLISSQSGFDNGVLSSADPQLITTLGVNQGFGQTLYPLSTSPVIDAVACGAVSVDERGYARPQGVRCDIGAVEVAPASTVLTVTGNGEPAAINSAACSGNQCPTLRDAINFALPGDSIRFAPSLDGATITLSLFSNNPGCVTADSFDCLFGVGSLGTEFGPSAFFIAGGTTVTIDGLTGLSRGITITRDVDQPAFRLFDVDSSSGLNLQGLTLSNGLAQGGGSGSGGAALGAGGAVFNQGTLTMSRCTLSSNNANGGSISANSDAAGGGGVGADADDTGAGAGPNGGASLGANGSDGGFGGGGGQGADGGGGFGGFGGGGGGGVFPSDGGFGGGGSGGEDVSGFGGFGGGAGGNGIGGGGGGMGGAIFNDAGNVTLSNTTLSGNSASGGSSAAGGGSGYGGAIFNYNGNVTLSFVTAVFNSVTAGGGAAAANADGGAIYSLGDANCTSGGNTCVNSAAALTVDNSIAANSTISASVAGSDVVAAAFVQVGKPASGGGTTNGISTATLTYVGANIVVTSSLVGAATTTGPAPLTSDPVLGALQDNGGGNFTQLPPFGSPAIDAAANCLDAAGANIAVDERGLPRPSGATCDLGAVEAQPFNQTISFPNPGPLTFSPGGTFALFATATSELPVSYVSNSPGVCSVSGSTVTILTAGNCSITVSQAGNSSFSAAPPVTDNIVISQLGQTIVFTSVAPDPAVGGIYDVTVTSGASGNPVTFATTGVCTVSGARVMFTGAGTCSITASQAGNVDYAPATPVQQTVVIGQAICRVNSNLDDPNDATAKVVSVDPLNWSGVTAGTITLRDCILAADLMTGSSGQPTAASGAPVTTPQVVPAVVITFASNLSGTTIVLGNELPMIFNNVAIDASSLATPITIDGGNSGVNQGKGHRIFFVSGLPSTNPATYVNGVPNPDGAQPIMVSLDKLILRNALARGGCSGGGGGGMGAGGALFVNQLAQVGLTDVVFAGNAAQGGDSSSSAVLGGTGGGGMGSRAVGGAGGSLGIVPGGDGQDCQSALAGVDGQDGRGIGASGSGNTGGGFGGTGLGQVSSAQNFDVGNFGGGLTNSSDIGRAGRIGGGGHFGNPGHGGAGGFGGGGGDGEGNSGSGNHGGNGGLGGGGGYGVGFGGAGGFGGGGGGGGSSSSSGSQVGGSGGFGGGGGGAGAYGPGLMFVPGGFGGGRGNVTGGGGAGFGGALFVRSGGIVVIQNTGGTQSIAGGVVTAGAASNGVTIGTPIDKGYGIALGQGLFLQGSAGIGFTVAGGATTVVADAVTGDCASGNTVNLNACQDGGVIKAGGGTLVLSAINSYNGATSVSVGTLQLDGSLISGTAALAAPTTLPSAMTINGGVLSGIGTTAGPVALVHGSVAPGDPTTPGLLSTGAVTWTSGAAAMIFRLGSSDAASDRLKVNGALLKSGTGIFRFHIVTGSGAPVVGHVYTLITSSNASAFSAADFATDGQSTVTGTFAIVSNQVRFTVTAVAADRVFANGFD